MHSEFSEIPHFCVNPVWLCVTVGTVFSAQAHKFHLGFWCGSLDGGSKANAAQWINTHQFLALIDPLDQYVVAKLYWSQHLT